jgi:hypothetical protein
MAATYRMLIDWLANGFADTTVDDVTARILDQRTPVTVRYGRDQNRQLSPTSPGQMAFELNNISRDYSPENASSPIAGFVAPARKVRFEATASGTTSIIYTGYLDDFDIRPEINERSVPASCIDALGRLKGVKVTTSLYRGIRTGDAVGYLLDAVGWPAADRDLDSGASFLPYWWLDDDDAYDALMQLADSEGPAALITVDGLGRIVFRDRHHRLTRSTSLNVQATWRSSGTEPVLSSPVTYDHGWKEIINSVSVEVPLRQVDSIYTAIWSAQGQITVAAGASLQITARASGPFLGALTPVQGTDFTVLSGSVTISLSRTSGQSTTITIAAASDAVIDGLQVRAFAIQANNIVVTVEDQQSIGKYGRKSMDSGRLPVWANAYDANAILALIVAKRAERLPTIAVTMRGAANATRLAECLGRNLSDRVHITESLTGLDADCFIEQISHTVGQGGLEHVTTFGTEKIPPVVTNPFLFDTAGQGFNQGVFGGGGLDNPATMFRFDTAGVGFDQGVFAN